MQALRGSALSLAVRLPRPVYRGRCIVSGIAAPAPTTRVRYIKRPNERELFIYTVPPPQKKDRVTNVDIDEVPMPLSDLRTANHMTLQQNGFELVDFPSGQGVAWEDKEQVCYRSCCCWILCGFQHVSNQLGCTGEKRLLSRSQIPHSAHDICQQGGNHSAQPSQRQNRKRVCSLICSPSTKSLGPMPSPFVFVLSQTPSHSLPQKPSCTYVQHNSVLLSPVKCVCRQADLSKLPDKTGHPISHPSVLTHVDFTESSGPKVLERYFGAEAAEQLKQKPWAIIQVEPTAILSQDLKICMWRTGSALVDSKTD